MVAALGEALDRPVQPRPADMPDYAWICHSCGHANERRTESCAACGFPAVASAAEIDGTANTSRRRLRQTRKEWAAARRADIAALPLWKKPIAYALALVRLIGAVIFLFGVFDLSISELLFGFGIAAVAELLFHLLKGRPYAWETRQ